jgi:lipoprotein-anchoring transpeptidase ErfK/SrfK
MRWQLWLAALAMVLGACIGGGAARSQVADRSCGNFLQCLFDRDNGSSAATRGHRGGNRSTAEVISWSDASKYSPGSIIVRTPERRLYYVLGGGKVRRYKVGVGREGFQWSGTSRIVDKQEWPHWRPPEEMIRREAAKGRKLPEDMAGGPNNPLGARALYIGGTLYRIHGSNDATSIGSASSSGCIRMLNADVMELYDRVRIGARVYVYQ